MSQERVNLLVSQMNYIWDKEEWVVPISSALYGVTASDASWMPTGGGNSIWQTVNHMNYYNERLVIRLNGDTFQSTAETNDDTFGEPGNAEDEEGWKETVDKALRISHEIRSTIASLTDGQLDEPFGNTTLAKELSSWVMHDAYHGGQLVLIRKQCGSWPAHRDM